MKYLIPICLAFISFTSCSKKNAEKQAVEDDKIIQQYISDNNLTASKTESGLYIVTEELGTGSACNSSSNVKVVYKGYYTDGVVFDQSSLAGITFNLQNVIAGWTEGIPHFKEGGKGKLLIPSALAYGTSGSGPIGPNTVILFDIELLEVL